MSKTKESKRAGGPGLFSILGPYRRLVVIMAVLSMVGSALTLVVPLIISAGIDAYYHHALNLSREAWEFGLVAGAIFLLTYAQGVVQVYASELVARDMRRDLAALISRQSNAFIQEITPSKLLTNLTTDIDAVKAFVAQAVVSLISSFFLIVGAAVLLLHIDWRLGLAVLTMVPAIGAVFFLTLRKVRVLFTRSREIIDVLNRIINESIMGAALIRVLHAHAPESVKFEGANTTSCGIGLAIVNCFAGLIPAISLIASLGTIVILTLGGHFVLQGTLSPGNFTAFNSYAALLVFPIIIVGFMGSIMASASASLKRINEAKAVPIKEQSGGLDIPLQGGVQVEDVSVRYGDKEALCHVSFQVAAGSRTAIIGPTAAGKTQLVYLLTGLMEPSSGRICFDGHPVDEYDKAALHRQVAFVFQDSIVFNMSLRENIAFSQEVTPQDMERAIATAELGDLIARLPEGLETTVSERGASLSGGQKQRLMLARALALNPRVLLLDDFTARVDPTTEARILANLAANYPGLTLISVTQKIAPIVDYDQIILLMEGELLDSGTHEELLHRSPEYMQIYNSQQSTNTYELHAE
jgi:ATP-binding cassette subfamily B protein